MRISLTNAGDYAVRAMLDIARHSPALRTNREISAAMDLPDKFLSQILATLVRERLLDSTSGPAGGYALARPPSQISVLDVIERVQGAVTVDECMLGGGACDWTQICPFHETWVDAKTAFRDRLGSTCFDELVAIDAAIRAGTYRVPGNAPAHPAIPPRRGVDH